MNLRLNYFDWRLVLPILFLLLLGIVVIWALAPQLVTYQIVFVVISAIVFLIISRTDYKVFQALHLPIYVVGVVSLLLPFIFGAASRGAHRWLQFGNINIQPSEITKPFFILTFAIVASGLSKSKLPALLGLFLVPAGIIFIQPDLGTTMVLGVAWFAILASQVPFKNILAGAVILVLVSPLGWFILRDYQRDRLITFVNPYHDPLGRGYHVIQSVIAVGSGQILGRGLGQGTQSNLKFLPESHTDFIFASLSENLGFIGGLLVVGLLTIVLQRIWYTSRIAADRSASLYCLAVMGMIAFQSYVNIGMNMGIVPITGITLPFLSYGGSSLLSLAVTLGLVHSIAIHSERQF